MTLTISDLYGLGDGNLAAGRMRIALFGALEPVRDREESEKCKEAYLAGKTPPPSLLSPAFPKLSQWRNA
jgi:hypothetical protein